MRRVAGRSFQSIAALAAVGLIAGCGGGGAQDTHEPTGNYPVQITAASFPSSQRLAEKTKLTLTVRNAGSKTIPNLTATICNVTCTYPAPVGEGTSVAPFAQYLDMPDVASHSRQVWVVDRPPGVCSYSCLNGGAGANVTADANTWAAGSLKPGASQTFVWSVTAVAAGNYTVGWAIDASLYGKSKAVLSDGSVPKGTFAVSIAKAPAQSYVNDAGQVVQGTGMP
jgi:hypothetical protein